MRKLILLISVITYPLALTASLDFDIHISNGVSNVNLSVIRDNTAEVHITVNHSDNDEFLAEINESIADEGVDRFAQPACDSFKEMMPETNSGEINSAGNQEYSFTPDPDETDDPEIYKRLIGLAEVSNDSNQLLRLTLTNKEAFSPAFASSIKKFVYSIECMPIEGNTTVLKTLKLNVEGTAFLIPFTETLEHTYSNYRPSTKYKLEQ